MKKLTFFLLVISLISSFQLGYPTSGYTYEYPIPKDNEIIALLLSESQMSSLCSKENYSTICSPAGVCYGIDRINYTLLTKIQFLAGKKESSQVIRGKLLRAYFLGELQIISGYESAQKFIQDMHKKWNHKDNPLKYAIEIIQTSQDSELTQKQLHGRSHIILTNGQKNVSFLEANTFEHYVLEGIPLHLGIQHKKMGMHALTIVGFKINITEMPKPTSQFYVLDSNLPDQLQHLFLSIDGTWYYEPWMDSSSGIVSLVWGEPTQSERDLARVTFRPHFTAGPTAQEWVDYFFNITPYSFLFLNKKSCHFEYFPGRFYFK